MPGPASVRCLGFSRMAVSYSGPLAQRIRESAGGGSVYLHVLVEAANKTKPRPRELLHHRVRFS